MKKLITLFLLLTLFGCGENNPINSNEESTIVTIKNDEQGSVYSFNENGDVVKIITAFGDEITYSYDNNGNLIKEESNYRWVKYSYNKDGKLALKEQKGDLEPTEYTYDKDGNLSTKKEFFPLINSQGEEFDTLCLETQYFYDNSGKLIREEVPIYSSWTEYFYDANNNKIKEESSDSSWTKYSYENNNLTKIETHDSLWITYSYDENNNIIKGEKSFGDGYKYFYDKDNRLIRTECLDGEFWADITYNNNAKIDPQKLGLFSTFNFDSVRR